MKRPTEDQLGRILSLLRGGAPLDAAVMNTGLPADEFSIWLARPRNRGVAARVGEAMAQTELQDIAVIKGEPSWQGAKARIELRRQFESERELHEVNALALSGPR